MRNGKCPKDKTELLISMKLWNSVEQVYCPKCGRIYDAVTKKVIGNLTDPMDIIAARKESNN